MVCSNDTMRMLSFFALTAVGFVAAAGVASAQSSPAPKVPVATRMVRDATFPLNMAYHAIGGAERAGATGHFIDAARAHYRGALDRYARNDVAGAAGEARLASDLARAAIDERPRPAPVLPKDIPAPPTPAARASRGGPGGPPGGPGGPMMGGPGGPGGPGMMGHGPMGEPDMMGGPGMMGGHGMMGRHGFGRMHHDEGFNATRLAALLKIENSPEARQLAQAAVDANEAGQRAALAGNVELASRQTRVSGDLQAAVRDLAIMNHPELARRRAPGPMGPRMRAPLSPGAPSPG